MKLGQKHEQTHLLWKCSSTFLLRFSKWLISVHKNQF